MSNRLKVRSEVRVYEVDGVDVPAAEKPVVVVESHWNHPNFVVLYVPETDERITVVGRDLQRAIENAMNAR